MLRVHEPQPAALSCTPAASAASPGVHLPPPPQAQVYTTLSPASALSLQLVNLPRYRHPVSRSAASIMSASGPQ